MRGRAGRGRAANWELFAWDALSQELTAIAELARELGLWTVLGSPHHLTPPNRPHNSLYVISDRGQLVTRYDERMLSNTKINHMYTPGADTRTFTVGGLRFGLLLGMEVRFPELFLEQERLDVDCVLFSTHNDDEFSAAEARGHAATNSYWVSSRHPRGGRHPAWLLQQGTGKPAAPRAESPDWRSSISTAVRRTSRAGGDAQHARGSMSRTPSRTTAEATIFTRSRGS